MRSPFFTGIGKPWFLLFLALGNGLRVQAQTVPSLNPLQNAYSILERHNFRKWENGKYVGLVSREVRGRFSREGGWKDKALPEGGVPYEGRFFLVEQIQHQGSLLGGRVEASFPASIKLTNFGIVDSSSVDRFPTMRRFPLFPKEGIRENRWEEKAERVLDPDFSGKATRVPVYVEYRYQGIGTYREEDGHRIKGTYAIRYRGNTELPRDPDLSEAQGTHEVGIFISLKEGGLRFITETFKEEYRYKSGRTLRLEGTVATFFQGGKTPDLSQLAKAWGPSPVPSDLKPTEPAPSGPPASPHLSKASPETVISPPMLPDVELSEKPEGPVLTIRNLRFKPDSAELLPEENQRLHLLSEGLRKLPGKKFLVVGHTADVGNPAGQKRLSVERAKAIVDALVKSGIPGDRFLIEGRGGTEPIASNGDEDGRARNRRVEILILDEGVPLP